MLRKIENPYLFLKFKVEKMKKMEVLCVKIVILEEGWTNKMMNSHEMQGTNEKILKNYPENNPKCVKHVFFMTAMIHEQVASSSCQKPM